MSGVPGGLLDHVDEHPPQVPVPAVRPRAHGELIRAVRPADDLAAARARVAVALPQLVGVEVGRGAELEVGIGLPVHSRPRLALGQSGEPDLEPVVLDQLSVGAWPDGRHWDLRWVLLHLIEETARHNGHADIVRESVDGATAFPLLAAAEGWPDTDWLKAWKP